MAYGAGLGAGCQLGVVDHSLGIKLECLGPTVTAGLVENDLGRHKSIEVDVSVAVEVVLDGVHDVVQSLLMLHLLDQVRSQVDDCLRT